MNTYNYAANSPLLFAAVQAILTAWKANREWTVGEEAVIENYVAHLRATRRNERGSATEGRELLQANYWGDASRAYVPIRAENNGALLLRLARRLLAAEAVVQAFAWTAVSGQIQGRSDGVNHAGQDARRHAAAATEFDDVFDEALRAVG